MGTPLGEHPWISMQSGSYTRVMVLRKEEEGAKLPPRQSNRQVTAATISNRRTWYPTAVTGA